MVIPRRVPSRRVRPAARGRPARLLFTTGVAAVGVQRLLELRRSRRNEAWLRARGAVVYEEDLPAMRAVHAGWLAASLAEVHLLGARPRPGLALLAGAGFVAGQALRRAAIRTLGPLWTVRVAVVPGARRVRTGPYRHLRHPNYLGVALEIASLPLLHGAWRTALAFSLANAGVLVRRIAFEEAMLAQSAGGAEGGRPHSGWLPRTRLGA